MENNKEKISSTQLKSEIIKLMDGMVAFQKAYPKFDFPKVSENFKLTRELIEKGEFNLAVCGKVKNRISKVQKESNFLILCLPFFLFCLFKHLFMKHRKIPKAQYNLHEG